MTRILNCEPDGYSPRARSVLEQVAEVIDDDLDRNGLLAALGEFDALIVRLRHQVDADVIGAGAPRLRFISSATTGLDHIDLDAATRRGVTVLSLQGETEFLRTISATAEHTWALLLAVVRHIPAASAAVERGEWDRDRFRGHQLQGKTCGIVGLGRVGSIVARYAMAFRMEAVAFDPHATDWVEGVQRVDSLAALLPRCDVLTLHVPLDPSTRGLIGREELQALPRGAYVVNTSRGEVIDESALCHAVGELQLGGVAADVVVGERRFRSPLLALAASSPNVVVTPHLGGATYESMEATEIVMAEKLATFLRQAISTNRAAS